MIGVRTLAPARGAV